MRNKSHLSKKIEHYLKKAFDHYSRGRKTSIVVEYKGKRYYGKFMENVALSEKDFKFFYNEEHFTFELENIKCFKRLRTKKYLFVFSEAGKAEKSEEKKVTKKKVSKKKETKKEE